MRIGFSKDFIKENFRIKHEKYPYCEWGKKQLQNQKFY